MIFSLLLSLLVPLAPKAQQIVGSWETLVSYGGTPRRVVDTPGLVYVLAQENLSSYDKETGEVYAYGKTNRLSDGKISDIYYNFDRDELLVVYQNDNIDLLTSDGRTINFPELMNAPLTVSKTIRDVAFLGRKIYLATNFGLVVLDTEKEIVEETGNYGFAVNAVTATPSHLIICVNYDNPGLWVAPIDASHTRFSAYTRCADYKLNVLERINDTTFFGVNNTLYLVTYNPETLKFSAKTLRSGVNNSRPQKTATGFMVPDRKSSTDDAATFVVTLDSDGNLIGETPLPDGAADNVVASHSGDLSRLWVANSDGYGLFDVSKQEFKINRMRPQGTSGPNVGHIEEAADGSLLIMTAGDANSNTLAYRDRAFVDRLSTSGFFTNVSPSPAVSRAYKLCPDPDDANVYALGARTGIYRVDASTGEWLRFDSSNSAVSGAGGIVPMMTDVKFDKRGLWALMHWDEDGADNLYFIPREAWRRGPVGSDVVALDFGTQSTSHSASILPHSSGLIIFSGANFIGLYNPGAKPADRSDDSYTILPQTVDADGMSINGSYVFDMEEDASGRVWLATSGGVRVIRDVKQMSQPGWVISRPKVARNDGTNLADFLLDNETVMDVCVDGNDNKWFATAGSGLYLVNSDGNEILAHYTAANSGLISDNVYAVHASRENNDVWVGTDIGLCLFHATTAPAASSYSDVYAYPNPVTPDYTGLITITGLMDKSLVKIADAAGNVFHQTVSEGGLIVWDGCDASGSRVRSGVYFVLASQNSSGTSAVVTKILVIN